MTWLDAVFRSRKPKPDADDRTDGVLEAVTFDGSARPAWATATGLYKAVGQSTGVAVLDTAKVSTADLTAKPLPHRVNKQGASKAAKIWKTQFHDEVAIGDEVALSLRGHPEARGVIVSETDEGRPVVLCSHCKSAQAVEDFNLAMLIKRGGDNGREC